MFYCFYTCCSLVYFVTLKATDVSRLSHARTTHSFIAISGLVNGRNLACLHVIPLLWSQSHIQFRANNLPLVICKKHKRIYTYVLEVIRVSPHAWKEIGTSKSVLLIRTSGTQPGPSSLSTELHMKLVAEKLRDCS